MEDLLLVAGAGMAASLVDGALGMGFGPTSATLLMAGGMSPAATSATVNLAKVGAGVAGGYAHHRLGNVDRGLVVRLAAPGVVGAICGAILLASVDGSGLRPFLAVLLLAVGARILWRFTLHGVAGRAGTDPAGGGLGPVTVVGATGGFTNGLVGAWGPVVTPYLLHRGVEPRIVVGSVNTAEIAVALASSGSLLTLVGTGQVRAAPVLAMLVGGVLAAPLAAVTVRRIPASTLGLAVAGLLLVTQANELGRATWMPASGALLALVAALAVAGAATFRWRRSRPAVTGAAMPPGRRSPLAGRRTTRR